VYTTNNPNEQQIIDWVNNESNTNRNKNPMYRPGQQLAQTFAAQKFGPGLGATPATGPVVMPQPPVNNPFANNRFNLRKTLASTPPGTQVEEQQ
jgi:hypothetical protein